MIALVLSMIVSFALAHGDDVRQTRDPHTGEGCCGVGWCQPVTGVRHVRGGYRLPSGGFIREDVVLPSDDNQFWLCSHPSYGVTCFFAPVEGL